MRYIIFQSKRMLAVERFTPHRMIPFELVFRCRVLMPL
ncbi:unnamed protein product [Anisakis simplex]|uniref:Uncharacterized protein n=1 Tax=Anisakis simplex TaxID=6269 RepID=A0A3P6RHJ8_ANISI|nr:unnamed protein product [Anisakis simplex]